jgi:hypothetical protein
MTYAKFEKERLNLLFETANPMTEMTKSSGTGTVQGSDCHACVHLSKPFSQPNQEVFCDAFFWFFFFSLMYTGVYRSYRTHGRH